MASAEGAVWQDTSAALNQDAAFGMNVAAICDYDGLAALEQEWWALWRRDPQATPFQSPGWLLPWWRTFHPGDLFTVAVFERARLVALAPFYIESLSGRRRMLPLGISVSDYLDIIVDPRHRTSVLAEIVGFAWRRGRWQEWELSELAQEANALALPCPTGCTEIKDSSVSCPYIALPGSPESVAQSFPPRKRRALRTAKNRADKKGGVAFAAASAAEADSFLNEVIRLHQARWIGRGEPGVFADSRLQQFHAEAVAAMMRVGVVRLMAAMVAGEPVAVYYGFHHRQHAYAYLMGMNPAYEFESPGAILLAHVIECAAQEGAREFHFLRGREPYKYGWGAQDRWNTRRLFQPQGDRANV